ncbi:EAL domain-containing protein [Pradoshia sp. D12]|uniref:EAL domain-containing protein n=1 Tax=Pradoshia sp. D12 TaxID=2651284 RepID=UPI0011262C48|nr:EAL domain-containing protein [Pradoshia sp. D12]QFK71072.1 EAL domain-containing protein [Pradoshia sp. D12]TPF72864.1 EAL domain-containing protein [Bacillus sp. D12]
MKRGELSLFSHYYTYGFMSPAVFIKIAEEAKLIVPLERLIIRQVFQQIKVCKREGIYIQLISINISVIHFSQEDFVEFFAEALKEYGLTGKEIGIEVIETIMMHDKQENNHLLQQLRQMGIQVSIDDFGTGYSSFSYLNQLAVDTLKIDKSFVDDFESNSKIISAIISMSHSLNLKVIAEGVETDKQMAFLKSIRCDEVQGYLYSEPVPAHELKTKLRRIAN